MSKETMIKKLIDKGIYKVGKRQLWELDSEELARLLEEGRQDGGESNL